MNVANKIIWRVAARFLLLGSALHSFGQQKQPPHLMVPTSPPIETKDQEFRDSHFGVRFEVPAGWELTRNDHEVSTFRMDARTAPPNLKMRGVLSLEFNPFPQSNLAGAFLYYSAEKHSKSAECVRQAAGTEEPGDTLQIGGMYFVHGHDEHGGVCVEARDDVYTAYRKGVCYRFDLELNTFCSVSSGAAEITGDQLSDIEERMIGILSAVTFDWSRTGAKSVHPPALTPRKKLPSPATPAGS